MTNQDDVVLVDPKQSGLVGLALYVLGAAQVIVGVWVFFWSDEQNIVARLILALLLNVSGILFLQVGRLLHEPKGGLVWEPGTRRFRLGGARGDDSMDVGVDDIRGVAVAERTERWGREETPVEVVAVELVLRSGATILVVEPGDVEYAEEIATGLRELTGLPAAEAPCEVTPRQEEVVIRVGAGSPLSRPLTTAGILSLGVGAVMMANVLHAPVFGFLFGPTIAAMGICFLALVGGKAMSRERIRLAPAGWRHEVLLGSRRFFVRELGPEDAPGRIRLATRGGQGFCLHLVRGGSVVVALGGVSSLTRLTPSALLTLAGDLAGRARAGQVEDR